MDDLVYSPSSISSLEKVTNIDPSTFVSVWLSLGERSVKVWLVSLTSHLQIGEGNLLASQRRVGSPRTYPCSMMTPSSLPSNSLAKGCSQAMSCPKKCSPSRSLFDQYTARWMQLPYQLCVGKYLGPGIWRMRSFLRPEQHWCPISYAPTLWLWRTKAIQHLTHAYCP